MTNTKKYFIVGFASFFSVLFGNVAKIFEKPLYGNVYYGQLNEAFFYAINTIILLILFYIIKTVLVKKLDVTYEKVEGELPYKVSTIMLVTTIICILIVSAFIGFEVKIAYDLGEGFTGTELVAQGVKIIFYAVLMMHTVVMIENFQYGLENIINFKNETLKKHVPLGGILTMLTLGTYSVLMGITTLPLIYFLLHLVYGWLYLIANRSFGKSYVPSIFIYLL